MFNFIGTRSASHSNYQFTNQICLVVYLSVLELPTVLLEPITCVIMTRSCSIAPSDFQSKTFKHPLPPICKSCSVYLYVLPTKMQLNTAVNPSSSKFHIQCLQCIRSQILHHTKVIQLGMQLLDSDWSASSVRCIATNALIHLQQQDRQNIDHYVCIVHYGQDRGREQIHEVDSIFNSKGFSYAF